MTNIITQLQEEIAGVLTADGWISGTPPVAVVTEVEGDAVSEIRTRIGRCGCAVVVMTPRFASGGEGSDEIVVTVMLGIGERPKINRGPTGTQRRAPDLAVALVAMLDGWQAQSAPYTTLSFRTATSVDGPEDLVTWELVFETRIRVRATDEPLTPATP